MTDQADNLSDESVADKLQQEAEEACRHLNAMAELCREATGSDKHAEVLASLAIDWRPGTDPQRLADTMLDQALAAASERSPVRRGHVYCYGCASAACDHSAPPSPGDVFMGYANNGEPVWREFFAALNELGDDRVDSIFDSRPKQLARFVPRKRLIQDQLIGSGRNSMTFRILCQVVAGYFEIDGKRCALTLQAVEDPTRRLFLHLIAPEIVQEAMTEPTNRYQTLSRLHAAVADLRHRLNDQQAEWRNATGRKERQRALNRVERHLQHQVAVIERKGRQQARRTKHAHDRGDDKRPIHSAMNDLAEATDENFFLDKPRNSIVVVGKRGRTHVFSREGKHVTTLQLSQEKLDRRVQRNRYAHLSGDEILEFKNAVDTGSEGQAE